MKIKELSLEELTTEINRAKFWVERNPIFKSLELINKMETQKLILVKEELTK